MGCKNTGVLEIPGVRVPPIPRVGSARRTAPAWTESL
jgi:hypothetical protein